MGEWRYNSTILKLGSGRRGVVYFTPLPLYPRGKTLKVIGKINRAFAFGQNAEYYNIKAACTYSNHCVLKVSRLEVQS
jgi:hypothetical protein